jgi:hypothetical protein
MSVDNLNNQFTSIRSGSASTTRISAQFSFFGGNTLDKSLPYTVGGVCDPTDDSSYSPVYQESGNFSSAPNSFQTLLDKNTIVQRVVTNVPNQKPYVYYATNNIGAGTN